MSIPSWARVGAKVVYVGGGTDKRSDFPRLTGLPGKGEIYTIRDIKIGVQRVKGRPVIRLAEIVTRPNGDDQEDAWLALSCFRPLITQQDDLEAHFRKLLDVPASHEREAV